MTAPARSKLVPVKKLRRKSFFFFFLSAKLNITLPVISGLKQKQKQNIYIYICSGPFRYWGAVAELQGLGSPPGPRLNRGL